jgi:FlaA1/EpsC-like NDP-sugar epimerase
MKILITGGTGSLGTALTEHLMTDNEIIIYSRDEAKQAIKYSRSNKVSCVIGNIRDFDKLNITVKRYKPECIIHAAALKRIDDMELHPEECIKTNVIGSENVAKAALLNEVPKCILVSTDKACKPVNVYGSSKFIAERIFTNFDYHSEKTIFCSVRYGNVLASRGSFIPLWLSLLKEKKQIEVTSLGMTRFLFTLGDAVKTVLCAINCAEGGEVFTPQISSYDMKTILKAVEQIHGDDFKFKISGLRPGEKLHEDMLADTEIPYTYMASDQLLCVRPQYTKRKYKSLPKYTGDEFNSSFHINDNVETLVSLIRRGFKEAR